MIAYGNAIDGPTFIDDIVLLLAGPTGPAAEVVSAETTGLPMANAFGPMIMGASRAVTGNINNHLFRLMAAQGREPSTVARVPVENTIEAYVASAMHDTSNLHDWEFFTTVNFANVDIDAINAQAGVEGDTWAPGVGVQRLISDELALGFAINTLSSNQTFTGGIGSAELDGEAASVYATYMRGDFWNSLLYSYGAYDLDTVRYPGSGFPTAHGDTRTETHTFQYNAGWNRYHQGGSLVTGPFIGIDYVSGEIEGFSETGGGAAALAYSDESYESLITRIGWSASKKYETSFATVTPQLRLSYERENLDNNGASVSLIGTPYVASGGAESPGDDYLVIGTGVSFEFSEQLDLSLGYQAVVFREDEESSYASIHLAYEF